jgi:hypothetical protein
MRKEVMINFWPNRAANDHVLIMTIDINSETANDQNELFPSPLKNNNARDL